MTNSWIELCAAAERLAEDGVHECQLRWHEWMGVVSAVRKQFGCAEPASVRINTAFGIVRFWCPG